MAHDRLSGYGAHVIPFFLGVLGWSYPHSVYFQIVYNHDYKLKIVCTWLKLLQPFPSYARTYFEYLLRAIYTTMAIYNMRITNLLIKNKVFYNFSYYFVDVRHIGGERYTILVTIFLTFIIW